MKKKFIFFSLILLFTLFTYSPVFAEDGSLKMTLTPPLIKNNMNPGETWASTVKLVNNNKEKLVVYAQILDFKSGKDGGVELIPVAESEGDGNQTGFLRQWMKVIKGPYEIKAFSSVEIPFEIKIPEDAEPGGHYAAVLIGTEPEGDSEGSGMSISSKISSLVLVNIAGDVIEEGKIREFSTDKNYYKEPKVNFKFKFENTGNVHLQPKGDIIIKDMFGEDVGTIDINKDTSYGNILPKSTKTWDFFWEGEKSIFKMGKYSATITVYYGEQTKEVDTRGFYFWYVDFKILGIIIASVLGFFLFIFLLIKLYVRRAIRQSQKEIEKMKNLNPMNDSIDYDKTSEEKVDNIINQNDPTRIIKRDIVDLRKINKE